jgi:hypothetical protein
MKYQYDINTVFYFMLTFYENVDYLLTFRGKQIPLQCNVGPRLARLILTKPHELFSSTKFRF